MMLLTYLHTAVDRVATLKKMWWSPIFFIFLINPIFKASYLLGGFF